jgi:hypothetical protein
MSDLLNMPSSRAELLDAAAGRALSATPLTGGPLADGLVRLVDEKEMSRLTFLKAGARSSSASPSPARC